MEENATVHSFSENTSTEFDYRMNNNTNSVVAMGNLYIRFLATSHIMFKIAEAIRNTYYAFLVPVGVIGNILSFLVMTQKQNRHMSFSLYVAALAVSDTISLLIALTRYVNQVFDVSMPPDQFWHCTIASSTLFICSLCSAFFVMAMTFERFYSIIRPHKAASFNTVKRAKIIIISIVIFSLIFNLPQWFIMSYQGRVCINYAKIHLTSVNVYFFTAFIFHFAIPFVSLLGMNSVIIHVLRKRSLTMSVRSASQGQDQSGGKMRSTEHQIYIMLLLVAFSFLLLNTPGYIMVFYTNFGNYYQSPRAFAGYYLFYIVVSHLFYTNYGINFFLYVISGQKFRSDLLRLFNCKKTKLRRGSSFVATSISTLQRSESEMSKS